MRYPFAFALVALLAGSTLAAGGQTIELHVLAGQSNAVGYGADPDSLPAEWAKPMPEVPFWYVVGPEESITDPGLRIDSMGGFVPLAPQHDPSGATFGPNLSGFGPELLMGRALVADGGSEVAIVKFALNGSDLALDWNPNFGGSLYHQMLAEVQAARAALELNGFEVEIGSFCWMQGESDALDALSAWLYEWNLEELVEHLRVDLARPDLPVVIGRLNQFIDGEEELEFPYLYAVRDAQLAVHLTLPATVLVDTDRFELGPDTLHFTAGGQVELGRHFAHAVLAEVTGYCSPQVSSTGCVPSIGALGVPSVSSPAGFLVRATEVMNQRPGFVLYGFAPAATPFLGGTLCVEAPVRRTPLRSSGGNTGGVDCSGSIGIDFTALVELGGDPDLEVGQRVYAQAWYRDPLAPQGSGLSDALSFVLTP